jgi:phage virion morphogenesis protein
VTGASIRIDHNAEALAETFEKLAKRADDMTPAMRRIAGQMLFSTQRRFEMQRGPGGAQWPALAPSTIERNPRRAPPAFILRDTARLYMSLTSDADAQSAEVGTNVVYGAVHQFGGSIKRKAATRTANFRLASQGAGRAKDGRRVGSKLRFAKARSRAKGVHQKTFNVPEFNIRIPARPYLGFDAADEAAFLEILGDEIEAATDGAAP